MLWGGRRRYGCVGAGVFGDQVCVAAQAVARAFDLNDDSVVKPPVEKRGGDNGVPKYIASFDKASVGGEDHCPLFISGVDELEEEICATLCDRQVANLKQKSVNLNHLTLPEIKDFNALSDALCCRLNGFRSRPRLAAMIVRRT